MGRLFGTDGVRGIAGEFPMTEEMAQKIGYAGACVLKRHLQKGIKKVIIAGRDTRESGERLFKALAQGIITYGFDVWDAGIITTPGISFLTKKNKALAGVVISASHNPYEYNGIKFFSPQGTKLPDDLEEEIENQLANNSEPEMNKKGKIIKYKKAQAEYLKYLKQTLPQGVNFKGMKLIIDCANGACSFLAPKLFTSLGAKVVALNNHPNGKNINLNCGSLHCEQIRHAAPKNRANVGFAFDGDGDRVLFTDEKGSDLDGDHLMVIAAKYLKKNKQLKNNSLVVTVMSNLGLHLAMRQAQIDIVQTKVGDRYVFEEMIKQKAILGGEQSGHIIFMQHASTGDGLLTALQILSIMEKEKKPLSILAQAMQRLPQILLNVKVKERKDYSHIPSIKDKIDQAMRVLGDQGRVLIRYSGTEPLLRVMIEGKDSEQIKNLASQIAEAIRQDLGEEK